MAAIKAFTDLEQSKKLVEILPLESADMFIADVISHKGQVHSYKFHVLATWGCKTFAEIKERELEHVKFIPCWSLATLLGVIPQEIFDGEYVINITGGCDNRWILTYDHYENKNHSYYGLSTGADNLIDACVAMIEKLHELKML